MEFRISFLDVTGRQRILRRRVTRSSIPRAPKRSHALWPLTVLPSSTTWKTRSWRPASPAPPAAIGSIRRGGLGGRSGQGLRGRPGPEYAALSFLVANRVDAAPRRLTLAPEARAAADAWIDGRRVESRVEAFDAMAAFVARLEALKDGDGAAAPRPASAACFSPAVAFSRLDSRLARLVAVTDSDPRSESLLAGQFIPGAGRIKDRCRKAHAAVGPWFEDPTSRREGTLSASVFGFHKMLRRADRTGEFVDFEDFGRDHPGTQLPAELGKRFCGHAAVLFDADDRRRCDARFKALFSVHDLTRGLVLLDELLAQRWSRRVLAGEQAAVMRPPSRRERIG